MFLSSYSPLIFLFSFSTLSQRKVTHLLNHPYTDIIACNKNTLLSLSSSSSSKSHKSIAFQTNVCYSILGATLFGRGLAFSTRVLACVYIEILCWKSIEEVCAYAYNGAFYSHYQLMYYLLCSWLYRWF